MKRQYCTFLQAVINWISTTTQTKEGLAQMAKDIITGRKTVFGNKRSKALNSVRRSWKPNLQKVRILVDGKPKRVWVSARALKSGKVKRA